MMTTVMLMMSICNATAYAAAPGGSLSRRKQRHSHILGRRSAPLPYPTLSSRHLLPGPISPTVSSLPGEDARVDACRHAQMPLGPGDKPRDDSDRKSTRLNSSH